MTFQITLDEKRKTGKSLSTNCYTANTLLIRTLVFSVNCGESFFLPPSAPLFKAVAVRDCNGFFCFKSLSEESKPFGPECAKPCRCAGAFTPKTDKALCLARHKQTILPPSAPPSRETAYPSLSGVLLPFSIHMPGAVSQAGRGETPPEPPNAQSARTAAPVRCR